MNKQQNRLRIEIPATEPPATQPAAATLGQVLALRPLDRLQINSRYTMRETSLLNSRRLELPFWYHQRVMANGQLEVRSPGGHCAFVDPLEVCDIVAATPIKVMAMPRSIFMQRLALSVRARQAVPAAECYAPASVLYARRSGNDLEFISYFDDASLNEQSAPSLHPLMDGEHLRLRKLASRRVMPIQYLSRAANWTADAGMTVTARKNDRAVAKFFASRLSSMHAGTEALVLTMREFA